ncbi:RES domain-containing protein [Bosea psychrotolerans]|uniref:RES domain-containing protein n=1 Tax=Bosea psychrotolerans TaxID=1871628 RepID=A0A2S4LU73_9HYPH|nr:RES family NAD+ phosphorylase [Bosea psychrotolerans]POR45980.1 RES domain-containing protein [Bosea psychrotolerans]
MIDVSAVPATDLVWRGAVRIIRSLFPPIDLFEDIADPADWPLILAAEQKTNPRLMESIGNLALVPPERRVSGPGASWLMAPFTHVSPDRPSRFSTGGFGVLYAGDSFEVALFETVHHHGRFMAATKQPPGWTSQFREILLDVEARLHDLRAPGSAVGAVLDPNDYTQSQVLGSALRAAGSEGVVYPSVRRAGGACVGLFYPDGASNPVQGRHLDYHWNGERVDLYRDLSRGEVYRIV